MWCSLGSFEPRLMTNLPTWISGSRKKMRIGLSALVARGNP